MSGREINDRAFWAGGPGKNSVTPDGPHKTKTETSVMGAGHVGSEYPDTTEDIKRVQEKGVSKIKGHPMRPDFRN